MRNFLNAVFHNSAVTLFHCTTRQLHYNNLVWRHVNKRSRGKHEDTFTEPHRVLQRAGRFTYFVSSHKGTQRKLQVNINDIKKFHLPDTKGWKIQDKYLKDAANELEIHGIDNKDILLDFLSIESMVQDIIDEKLPKLKYFIIPDWPCMSWYSRLHKLISAEAIKLPNKEDVFINQQNRPLGIFAWDSWLFQRNLTQHACINPTVTMEAQYATHTTNINGTDQETVKPTNQAEIKGRYVIFDDLSMHR